VPVHLDLLAATLGPAPSARDVPESSWAGVLALADSHQLLPALWIAAVRRGWFTPLPAGALDSVVTRFPAGTTQPALLLQQAHAANALRVGDLMAQGATVLAALDQAAVAAVPLKGWHGLLAVWWPDPAARVMRDLDVLVGEDDAPRAARVLGDLGYVAMDGDHDPHADHELAPVHLLGRPGAIEIHTAVLVRRWRAVLPAGPVLAAGRPMDATDSVTHLIAHAQLQDEAHLLGRLPLRSLHELAVISQGPLGPMIAWDVIRRRFAGAGAEGALDSHLHLARVLFDADVPRPRRAGRALGHEWLCRAMLKPPQPAQYIERALFLPRALSAERMHQLHGPGPLWALRLRHVAHAATHPG
jgi:hypothetical protein